MALFTVLIYLVGRDQWRTFQQQLTVMQGQLDAMEADQRPWMKIEKLEPYKSPIDPIHLPPAASPLRTRLSRSGQILFLASSRSTAVLP